MKLDRTEVTIRLMQDDFTAKHLQENAELIQATIDATLEALNMGGVEGQREQLLEEQSNWLMANTSLEVEKIVDFKEHFK